MVVMEAGRRLVGGPARGFGSARAADATAVYWPTPRLRVTQREYAIVAANRLALDNILGVSVVQPNACNLRTQPARTRRRAGLYAQLILPRATVPLPWAHRSRQ